MNKKENPIKTYTLVSQLTFVILTPLLLFIWGGCALVDLWSLPGWVKIICIVLGILVTVSSTVSYIVKLIRIYDKDDKSKYKYISDKKDNDYFYDN